MKKQDLMSIDEIQQLADPDMQKVNQNILAQLNSDVSLIGQLGFYIVQGGGKRIRPLIAVLAARSLGFEGANSITCATFVEFIHIYRRGVIYHVPHSTEETDNPNGVGA